MNSLSWMIYAAGVSEAVQTLLAVAGGGVLIVGGLATLMLQIEGYGDGPGPIATAKKYVWLPLLSIFLACLIPSQITIYAIAASEMGESVANTPAAAKAMKALDVWLDRQIADAKGDSDAQ